MPKISGGLASAALLFLAAVPAAAAGPDSAPSSETAGAERVEASAQPAKAEEPKKICRTYKLSSSRLGGKRICMTREEWRRSKMD
ncbi:MAG TPA: hypothetical protein VD846_12310 [Allosphingosinicella sp.]|nr:hypothetical protein [Allosphingosinicella sp.]